MEDNETEKKTETRSKLSEGDILARATLGLTKSQSYTASDIEQKRAAGFRQYKRDPYKGDDQLNGRSGYVTSDVHDNVNWMLSNLMALFDSQDRVVQFSPTGPEYEALAEQQTDVVNYVVTQQNNFAVITRDWLANGLIGGLGIVTAGYYKSKSWKPAKLLQGVAIPKLVEMSQSKDVEILEASPPYPDPASAISGTELFDLRVREAKNNSRVEIRTLAPEDFFVSKDAQFDYATGGIDAALQGFKRTLPRAELTEMGYDPAKIAKIPAATSDASDLSQDRNRDQGHNDGTGDVEEEVELFEVFMRIDANGDGIRELLHTTIGGSPSGGAVLLAHKEVELAPFAAFVPFMMPNTLAGM